MHDETAAPQHAVPVARLTSPPLGVASCNTAVTVMVVTEHVPMVVPQQCHGTMLHVTARVMGLFSQLCLYTVAVHMCWRPITVDGWGSQTVAEWSGRAFLITAAGYPVKVVASSSAISIRHTRNANIRAMARTRSLKLGNHYKTHQISTNQIQV